MANGIYSGFTLQQLEKIAKDTPFGEEIPSLNIQNAQKLLKADLNFYLYLYGITTPIRKAYFIAEVMTETGSLSHFRQHFDTDGNNFDKVDNDIERGRGLIQLTGIDNYKMFEDYVGISGLRNRPDLVASNISLNMLAAMWFYSVHGNFKGNLNSFADANVSEPKPIPIPGQLNQYTYDIDSAGSVYKISLAINGSTNQRSDYTYPNQILPNGLAERQEYFKNAALVLKV
ncbi:MULTISPECIES: hypothetical protein [Pseudanabaena]|uniref:Glycoside hydrolase family 19 catalytic domain-containing protein n=1 Tax=Pseudanabaena catenata USMAC16 TaxID=1855837 RepID=A0A9X4MCV5_9CYAN|nr:MULTISPECIES: hypothetical protein [Pseudanabaena]MDG3497027.1 hypothetical protein [Pseudanabaena catenata USMAC16]